MHGTRPVSSSRYIEIDSNFTLYTSVWIISQMLKALLKNGVVFRRRKIKAQQTECLGSKRLGISGWWGLPKAESVVKIGKVFHPFVQQIPHIDKAHQKLLDVKNRLLSCDSFQRHFYRRPKLTTKLRNIINLLVDFLVPTRVLASINLIERKFRWQSFN